MDVIDDNRVQLLADIYNRKVQVQGGEKDDDEEDWCVEECLLTMIPKKTVPKKAGDMLGIEALTEMGRTWVNIDAILMERDAGDEMIPEWQQAWMPKRGAGNLVVVALAVLRAASAGGGAVGMASVDIDTFFDTVRWDAAAEAAAGSGCSWCTTRRALLSSVTTRWKARYGTEHGDESVVRQRGLPQGRRSSVTLAKWTIARLLGRLENAWQRAGYGVNAGGVNVCVLDFADNVWLLAKDRATARCMVEDLETELMTMGMALGRGCEYIVTDEARSADEMVVQLEDHDVRLKKVEKMEFLGTTVAAQDQDGVVAAGAARRCWRSWWTNAPALRASSATLQAKVKLLRVIVGAATLYGMAWTPLTKGVAKRLAGLQRRCVLMLLRDGKSLDGRVADDWRDENRQVSLLVARAGSWAADAARCRWRWFWAARAGRHGELPQRALLLRGATWRAERVRRGLRRAGGGWTRTCVRSRARRGMARGSIGTTACAEGSRKAS